MGEIEQLFLLANNSCMIESRVKFFFFMRFDDFFSCFIMVIFVVVVFFNFFFRFSVLFFFWFHSSGVGSFSRVCGIFEGGSCLFVDGVLALKSENKINKIGPKSKNAKHQNSDWQNQYQQSQLLLQSIVSKSTFNVKIIFILLV